MKRKIIIEYDDTVEEPIAVTFKHKIRGLIYKDIKKQSNEKK